MWLRRPSQIQLVWNSHINKASTSYKSSVAPFPPLGWANAANLRSDPGSEQFIMLNLSYICVFFFNICSYWFEERQFHLSVQHAAFKRCFHWDYLWRRDRLASGVNSGFRCSRTFLVVHYTRRFVVYVLLINQSDSISNHITAQIIFAGAAGNVH